MNFETKTLPSGIVIENVATIDIDICRWHIKGTNTLHNEGEPAIEYKDGSKFWYLHGIYHRLDGPALSYASGIVYYFIDNELFNKKDYWKHPEVIKYQYLKEHPELEAFV